MLVLGGSRCPARGHSTLHMRETQGLREVRFSRLVETCNLEVTKVTLHLDLKDFFSFVSAGHLDRLA